MSIPLNVNGIVYDYPETDDQDWGPDATDWASAVTTGMLQKAGGLFQLLAEADFGSGFGLKALYYKSRTANPAAAGQVRFARADLLSWRNQANSGDLSLGVSASDNLQFNGVDIQPVISVTDTATIDLTLTGSALSADIVTGSITNAMINAGAAIAYSKLALTGSIVNADLANMAQSTFKGRAASSGTGAPVDLTATQATAILNAFAGDSGSGGTKGLVPAPAAGDTAANKFLFADGTWATPPGAGDVVGPASSTNNGFAKFDGLTGKILKDSPATISYAELVLTNSIVNADIAASAAIAYSKLAALTTGRALVSDGSGFVSPATTTATEIGYVNGVTSAIQTQINTKLPTTITTTGDMIYSSSGTTASRLAIGTGAQQIISPVAGIPAWVWPLSVQTSQTTTYSISATADNVVFLNANGGAFTATLPTAASVTGKVYYLKKTDATTNAVTIATTSSQTIDGVVGTSLNTQNETLKIVSDGSNWQILERRIPSIWVSYTPTYTNLGTVTNIQARSRRVGDSLQIMGSFTTGTPAGATCSISLGFNGTSGNVTVSTVIPAIGTVVGKGNSAFSNTTGFSGMGVFALPSVTVVYPTNENSTQFGFGNQFGTALGTGGSYSYSAQVPILGWNG